METVSGSNKGLRFLHASLTFLNNEMSAENWWKYCKIKESDIISFFVPNSKVQCSRAWLFIGLGCTFSEYEMKISTRQSRTAKYKIIYFGSCFHNFCKVKYYSKLWQKLNVSESSDHYLYSRNVKFYCSLLLQNLQTRQQGLGAAGQRTRRQTQDNQ